MGFFKSAGGLGREVGRAFFGGGQKPGKKPGFAQSDLSNKQKPQNQSVFGLLFPSRPKPKAPEQTKDASVFSLTHGRDYAIKVEKERWLEENRKEIYKITKGRVVGESELKKFGEQLFADPIVKKRDFGQHSRGEILKRLEKESWTAKNKYDARENIEVAKKMLGLDKKK